MNRKSYSEELMDSYRRRMGPLVGAGPYNMGKAIHLGWDPAPTCPTIKRFVDEVPINELAPTAKGYYATATDVSIGWYTDGGSNDFKFESIFVLEEGVANIGSYHLPWRYDDVQEVGGLVCSLQANIWANAILNPDILDSTKPMYYKNATWNTHNYDYAGAAHGSVLYANPANWATLGAFQAAWVIDLAANARVHNTLWERAFLGEYLATVYTGTVYAVHMFVAGVTSPTVDAAVLGAPGYTVQAYRAMRSNKTITESWRARGHVLTSDFEP